jgi:hypothetical protein
MSDRKIKKSDIPNKLGQKNECAEDSIVIFAKPPLPFQIVREKKKSKCQINRRRHEKQQVFSLQITPRIGQIKRVKPNQNAVTVSDSERKISQPLIQIINIRKPDKRRNKTQTKHNKQACQPQIRRLPLAKKPQNEHHGKYQTLQNCDKANNASRVKKIYLHKIKFLLNQPPIKLIEREAGAKFWSLIKWRGSF